jgi:hypothetical protein
MIIVEDGSGVVGANSYVSAAEFIDFWQVRGLTISPADSVRLLLLAADFIESLEPRYRGDRVNVNQSLSFPRTGFDCIPRDLKTAQIVLGKDALNGALFGESAGSGSSNAIKTIKAGDFEAEFKDDKSPVKADVFADNPQAMLYLDRLLIPPMCAPVFNMVLDRG